MRSSLLSLTKALFPFPTRKLMELVSTRQGELPRPVLFYRRVCVLASSLVLLSHLPTFAGGFGFCRFVDAVFIEPVYLVLLRSSAHWHNA